MLKQQRYLFVEGQIKSGGSAVNKPERNRCKTADGWSFPARAASPPRRSFPSSSRKPFGATDDHVTHTHTHNTTSAQAEVGGGVGGDEDWQEV